MQILKVRFMNRSNSKKIQEKCNKTFNETTNGKNIYLYNTKYLRNKIKQEENQEYSRNQRNKQQELMIDGKTYVAGQW